MSVAWLTNTPGSVVSWSNSNPISGLLLLQLTTEPGVLVSQATDTASPAQYVNGPGFVSTGCAFKVMLNVIGALVQRFFVAVTVAIPMMSAPVVLAEYVQPGMFDEVPLAVTPIDAAFVMLQL